VLFERGGTYHAPFVTLRRKVATLWSQCESMHTTIFLPVRLHGWMPLFFAARVPVLTQGAYSMVQIGTGNAGPPGSEELEIDQDMSSLDLRLKRLTNLPWDLSVLTNLKELDLSMNLYTQMPDQLLWKDSHLATSLTKLSINQNRIQVLPDDIQEMNALQTLCVYDNTLTALPKTICNMRSLTQLSLYNNFITDLPEEFCRIPKVRV
jgi:hypothetical protein